MRVLAVFFHPGVGVTAVGGAERRFLRVLGFLLEAGVGFWVMESSPSLLSGFRGRLRLTCLPGFRRLEGGGWLSIYAGWLLWLVKALPFTLSQAGRQVFNLVLASNNNIPNLLLGYLLSRLLRVPLCVVVHHVEGLAEGGGLSSVYRACRGKGFGRLFSLVRVLAVLTILGLLRRAEACIAVSASTARLLKGWGVSRVYVSGNAVDLDCIQRIPPQPKRYDAIFVGRMSREKGVYDLLRVWPDIVSRLPKARLIMVGSGPELEEVKRAIRRPNLGGRVIVRGPCSDREMYGLMKASRVFVFPSLFEGWGIAVAEALACGLPVVCYDIPSLREVFGGCGSVFFVPPNDLEELKSAILGLLEKSSLEDLAGEAEEYVKRFSWRGVAEKDLEVIRRVASKI